MKTAALMSLLLLCITGCASTPRWQGTRQPDAMDAAELLASDSLGLQRDQRPDEVPIIPVRNRLRPCCAFGSNLHVQVGLLKIPGFSIRNIHSPNEIGFHNYDAGQRGQDINVGSERNGLVYTCRGGFIDTAHVRDYADWTLYLATRIGRQLETGGVIDLPGDEGGQRRFVLQPIDPEFVRIVGRRNLTASLAVAAGFQLSIWHEIATWYGWSSFGAFPERGSAFSPEDLYSNLLGAKLVGPIISSGDDVSEGVYDRAIDAWFKQALQFLGAVPAAQGEAAMASIDQHWWNSKAHLPDVNLVLRRNMQIGARIEPWLVPAEQLDPSLATALQNSCEDDLEPHILRNPSRIPQLDFEGVLNLEISLNGIFQGKQAFKSYGATVRQSDFPELFEQIRTEMRAEFGPKADSPQID
jgi:hypothetical protein